MPKIVDHDERRTVVLDATWRVIAREGLHGVTLRRIAVEAGFSSGVLAHYFNGKEDILISAHKLAYARAGERIERATKGRTGVDALRAAILEALPLDAERYLEAQVDVSFLGQMVGNERLRAIRSESNSFSRSVWRTFVVDAQNRGEIVAELDPELVADELNGLIDSLSVEAIIDPEWMTPARQLMLTERMISRLCTP